MTAETLIKSIPLLPAIRTETDPQSLPWFKRWFDTSHYQKLYAYRDEAEARKFMNALLSYLEPAPEAHMIDVGCGTGRHSKHLASKGFHVTGIDLSRSQITEAKKHETDQLRFFRQDMRQPFGRNQFDYAFNLFTSFGYFNSLHEHCLVINNLSASLKQGGILIMDYLNVPYTERHLVGSDQKIIDGIIYDIERWMTDSHFYKKISIHNGTTGLSWEYTELVAKFMIGDFSDMFSRHQLELVKTFGNYNLDDYDVEESPRMIMIAQKL